MSADNMVTVPRDAIEWLKTHYPALTVKAGLCESIAGRLYTRTSLQVPQSGPTVNLAKLENDIVFEMLFGEPFSSIRTAGQNSNSCELVPPAAEKALRTAVHVAVTRTAREIAEPVWPYRIEAQATAETP